MKVPGNLVWDIINMIMIRMAMIIKIRIIMIIMIRMILIVMIRMIMIKMTSTFKVLWVAGSS